MEATLVVAHVVTVPIAPLEITAGVPAMDWIAPSAVPGPAPATGIVPGTAASNGMRGDGMRTVGALPVGLLCAKVEVLPNKAKAVAMRASLRIGTSCVLTHKNRYR
jgi:hypothetical protein